MLAKRERFDDDDLEALPLPLPSTISSPISRISGKKRRCAYPASMHTTRTGMHFLSAKLTNQLQRKLI